LFVPTSNPGGPGGRPGGIIEGDGNRPRSIGQTVVSLGSEFVDIVLNGLGLSLLAIVVPLMVAGWLTIKERTTAETRPLHL
jgi:hypothetical protein